MIVVLFGIELVFNSMKDLLLFGFELALPIRVFVVSNLSSWATSCFLSTCYFPTPGVVHVFAKIVSI